MTLKQIIICTISINLTLSGCSYVDKGTDDLKTSLLGTWVLDSVSTPSKQYVDVGGKGDHHTLTFINKTDYSFEWWNDDVGNTFVGKYFILDNPKRGLKTITLIPDLQIGEDTVRTEYMNFDIVSIGSTRFQVVDETNFIKRDSLKPYINFNKNYIYKRIK